MRNIILIMVISVTGLFASSGYSQSARVSLDMENAQIKDVLAEIERTSEFYFLYSNKLIDVDRKVNIHADNHQISEILDGLFPGSDVEYVVIDNQIILSPGKHLAGIKLKLQPKTITGTITDQNGDPLPGVSVAIKGTTHGVITNMSGEYSIPEVPEDATLVFSYVGMTTQEIPVKGQTSIDVVFEETILGIDEVTVIGYGTIKKKDVTGSVASVQGDILAEKGANQLSQALQGSMSGLMVTRTNGFASQSAEIRIRGITTINNSNPLIIVDGIPAGSLDDVHSNDVESISVLKDAASTSIYGSRAASGVILVTTKRAKSGTSIDYNFEYGFEKPTRIPENPSAVEYMTMFNEMRWNDNGNIAGDEYSTYSKDLIDNYPSLNKDNPDLYPDWDWMKVMLNDYAPRQSHVLNLNAGYDNLSSKVTMAYDKIDALYDSRSYERYTVRANNDVTINRFLSSAVDLNYIRTIDKRPILDFTYYDFRYPPIYAPYWSNGTIGPANTTGQNAYPIARGDAGYNNHWRDQLGGKISVDFKPVKGLKISGIISPSIRLDKYKKYVKKVPFYDWDDPNVIVGYNMWAQKTSLNENRNDYKTITTQVIANYEKDMGVHHLNALAGYEYYYTIIEYLGASRDQYEIDNFPYLNLGPLTYRDNSGSASELAYRSWFGRFMYNFKDKYLLQVNSRYDGSSRFAEEYRWGFFPSVSAGWVISEEPFMEQISPLSFLKLRASWGKSGNERIGNYPYQSTVSFSNTLAYMGNNITSVQSAYISKYAIRDISWETTESYDIGLDANFFTNRLRITGDYYKKTTKDMLLPLEIPDYIGFENPDQNTGEMYTNGWDFEIGWRDMIGDLKYSISFNLSDFESVIGDIGGIEYLGEQVKFEGSEFNEWYGYISEGLYQTQEEVDNSATINLTVSPGDVKYKDVSGPEGVPDGLISPEYDRVLLGGSLPRYLYGGNIRLDYKNFDFSLVFQGVGKQNAYITQMMVTPRYGDYKLINGDYWSLYNTEEQNKKVKYPRFLQNADNNFPTSDLWMFNGAYFRLKNITLGYSIPSQLVQKVRITGARIYASISDLISIDNYPTGYDPEGVDFFITKMFLFGCTISL